MTFHQIHDRVEIYINMYIVLFIIYYMYLYKVDKKLYTYKCIYDSLIVFCKNPDMYYTCIICNHYTFPNVLNLNTSIIFGTLLLRL